MTYEGGVKSTLADGRIILNAAVFYIDWTDVKIDDQYTDPDTGDTTGYTSNAGEAEVKGFEIFVQLAPTDNLDLSFGYSYNPARVFDYPDRRANNAGIDTLGEKQLPFSSDYSFTGAIGLNGEIGPSWTWYGQLDAQFESTQYATVANLAETGDRFFTNLLVGFDDERWSIQGYVNNLFDSGDATSITPFVSTVDFSRQFAVNLPNPRQLGVRVRLNF